MTGREIVGLLQKLATIGQGRDKLLIEAVHLLQRSSPHFNWVGVYELAGDVLVLGPYVGAKTEHTRIPVGRGVCGTAVAEARDQNVPDVTKTPNYLACSTATKSELVVLIRNGDRIYGQIDIDSHTANAFGPSEEQRVTEVATFLATLWN
ncbi:MAG: GAF domain-containing protein [Planctomycetes bacterium]|nr:GAF domain-containing protein [Planctomycetota bacterium]MBI3845430.1 GAF domain-containing protein [Planctomycetota bacterium]